MTHMGGKKVTDFDAFELKRLLREVRWEDSLKSAIITKHLGVSVQNSFMVAEKFSLYEFRIYCAVFYKFLALKGFEVVDQSALNEYGNPDIFEYQNIEINPGEMVQAPEDGYSLICKTSEKVNLIVGFSPMGSLWKIKVYSSKEHELYATTFLRELGEYAKEENVYKGKKLRPDLTHVKLEKEYNWDSVILPDLLKRDLQRNINLLFGSLNIYKANGMSFKRGLILKGAPGLGKTLVGKILCSTTKDVTFLWVAPGDVDTPKSMRRICELSRDLAPSILFLEDIDLFGGHREKEDGGVLGELMNQLDGIVGNEFVVVVATTNRPDEVEGALRNRPGRFDRLIDFPLPDEDCRFRMLELYTKTLQFIGKAEQERERFLKDLSKRTDGMSGAHLKELVNTAMIAAIDEGCIDELRKVTLKASHFLDNIQSVAAKKITPAGFAPTGNKREWEFDWDE